MSTCRESLAPIAQQITAVGSGIFQPLLMMLQDPRLNFELVNEVRNNFREVMLLFQKKRRAA